MGQRIAIIGGTGKEGKGLAFRWASSGHDIVIGSRQIEKAQIAADEINQLLKNKKNLVTGLENHQAADWCDIAVLTVPYSAHRNILAQIKECIIGKILIDVTVPLVPPKVTTAKMPIAGSAALEAREILGNEIEVVSAFQNISYDKLLREDKINCDVLVSGTTENAIRTVLSLVTDAGMVGWNAGPLENSITAESLTSILIGINKQFGIVDAGIKITGVNRENN